jgi:Tol biopolymer transport system component
MRRWWLLTAQHEWDRPAGGPIRGSLSEQGAAEHSDGAVFVGTTYSPDGRKIAYVQTAIFNERHSHPSLYKMNALDGSNKQLIYETPSELGDASLSSPDWGDKVQR